MFHEVSFVWYQKFYTETILICVDGETGNNNVSPGYNIDCRA